MSRHELDEDDLRALAGTVRVGPVRGLAVATRRRYPAWRRVVRRRRVAAGGAVVALVAALSLGVALPSAGGGGTEISSGPATSPSAPAPGAPRVTERVMPGADAAAGMVCPSTGTCYVSSASGPAAGGVLVTHDGGRSWADHGPAVGSLSCPSAEVCAGVGRAGRPVLVETVDGGATWATRRLPGRYGGQLSCTSASRCVLAEQRTGRVARTGDGGRTWSSVGLPSGLTDYQPFGLSCSASGRCITVGNLFLLGRDGDRPVALYSTDAGRTWRRGSLPAGFNVSRPLSCGTPLDCMAVGNDRGSQGAVVVTDNGGRSWRSVTAPGGTESERGYAAVACTGPSTCALLASADHGPTLGVVETTDLGSTWQLLASPAGVGPGNQIACAPSGPCYAVAGQAPTSTSPSGRTSTSSTVPSFDTPGAGLLLSW